MNKNTTAYSLLFTVHDHLATKHNVPSHILDSYRYTIAYVVPFYSPRIIELLNQSIRIRNKVCHFRPLTNKDVRVLQLLCKELKLTPNTEKSFLRI